MNPGLAWWQRPVRMMRRDYLGNISKIKAACPPELARESRERWHINCEWIMANMGCAPGMAQYTLFNTRHFQKAPGLGKTDVIRAYLPHARKHGIHVVPYVNLHWFSYAFAKKHPGWEQVLENGTPYGRKYPLYGNGTTMCINGPWRNWAFELLREVMATGVDGCFLDGPVVFPRSCYCKYCRKLFAERTNQPRLPEFGDWSDPLWKEFIEFRQDSMAVFLKDAQAVVRAVNSRGIIFLNGGWYHASQVARDPERLEPFQNYTAAEEFFHASPTWISPFRTLHMARFLSAGNNPAVVFTHHTLSTWHYIPLPPAEMTAAIAQTTAGGANPWFAVFMDGLPSRSREAFAAVQLNKFLEKHERHFTAAASAAETAVLVSQQTLDYYLTHQAALVQKADSGREVDLVMDRKTRVTKDDLTACRNASVELINNEYAGCFDALTFSHIPMRILWDRHVSQAQLGGIKTLVLPNAACLSNRQISVISQFVRNGGNLIATFESGFYDERGVPGERRAWLEILGIEKIEGVFKPSRNEDYWTVTTACLPGYRPGTLLPRPMNGLKVFSRPGRQILVRFNEPIGQSYAVLKGASRYAGVIFSRCGRGNVLYIAAPIFESFNMLHLADYRLLVDGLLSLAAGRAGTQVKCTAPGSVAVELRRRENDLQVHLVNTTSEMKRPMEQLIPVKNMSIAVRAKKARGVHCLRSGKKLPFKRQGDKVMFIVPEVRDYEVVILAGGKG